MASGAGGNWSDLVGPARYVALTRDHVVTAVGSELRRWDVNSNADTPAETIDLGSRITAMGGNDFFVVVGLANGGLMAWEVGLHPPSGLDAVVEAVNAGSGTTGVITSVAMTYRGRLVIGRSDGRVAVVPPVSAIDMTGQTPDAPSIVVENLAGVAASEPWNVMYTDAELTVWQGRSATNRVRERRISSDSSIRPGSVTVSVTDIGWVGRDGTAWRCTIPAGQPVRQPGEGHAAMILPEGGGEAAFVGADYGDAPTAVVGTTERSAIAFLQGRVQMVARGQAARDLVGHTASIVAIARAGDGVVVSAQSDGNVRWWSVPTGDLIAGDSGTPVRALCASDDLTYVARIDGSIEALRMADVDPARAAPIGDTVRTVQSSAASETAVVRRAAISGTGRRVDALTLGRRLIAVTPLALVVLDRRTLEVLDSLPGRSLDGPVVELDDGRIFVGEGGQPREVGGTGHTVPEWPTPSVLLDMAPHGPGGMSTIHRDGRLVEWEGTESDAPDVVVSDIGGGSAIRAADGLDGDLTVVATRDGSLEVIDRTKRTSTRRSVPLAARPLGVALVGTTAVVHDGNTLAAIDVTVASSEEPSGAQPQSYLDADRAVKEDAIGAKSDATALARVLAARSTKAPIAVALLGEWGSGKSSFMQLVDTEIADIAERSRNRCIAARSLEATSYCSSIAQIHFNAWTYADAHLWSGMIRTIFTQLADRAGVDDAASQVAQREQKEIKDELATATSRLERTTARLASVDAMQRTLDDLPSWLRRRARVRDTVRTVSEARDAYATTVQSVRRSVRWWLPVLLASAVLLALVIAFRDDLARAVRAIGVAVAAVSGVVSATVGLWRGRVQAGIDAAGKALDSLAGREQTSDELARDAQTRDELIARREAEQRRVDQLTHELAMTDPARRLSRFLAERRDTSDYDSYRGLLYLVQRDLEALTEALGKQEPQFVDVEPESSADESSGSGGDDAQSGSMVPLQRIIVYVDDLDRCSPERVVEVLAAVHLMLAVEKFIVVVAVDPRWLLRCLQYHYAKLLDADDTGGPMATTPIDYLEKIFQIAYRVPKLDDGFDQYVRGLLPVAPAAPAPVLTGDDGVQPAPVSGSRPDAAPVGEAAAQLREEWKVTTSDPSLATLPPEIGGEIADLANVILARRVPEATVPDVDLVLDALTVTAEEQDVAAVLLPLLETPRAVKRLANSYRLYRASIPVTDLPQYLAERRFEPAMVLLAAAVGQPLAAPSIFQRIAASDDGSRIADVFAEPRSGNGDRPPTMSISGGDAPAGTADGSAGEPLAPAVTSSALGPTKDAGPVPDRSSEHEAIGRFRRVLAAEDLTVKDVDSYRRCIDHVARFSFRYMELTGRVAGGTGRPGVVSAPVPGPPPPPPVPTGAPPHAEPA